MARKKKPLPVLENVTITGLAAEGKAIARVDDVVVFVPFAVPGDVVDLQVTKKRHRYMEAVVTQVRQLSQHLIRSIMTRKTNLILRQASVPIKEKALRLSACSTALMKM